MKHGFGYGAEGCIIGKTLLTVIKKLGERQGNKFQTEKVKSTGWLSNSESTRLQYFSTLAQQVENNVTVNAIQHFSNPKHSINSWLRKEVDAVPRTQAMDKCRRTIDSEFDRVYQARIIFK